MEFPQNHNFPTLWLKFGSCYIINLLSIFNITPAINVILNISELDQNVWKIELEAKNVYNVSLGQSIDRRWPKHPLAPTECFSM